MEPWGAGSALCLYLHGGGNTGVYVYKNPSSCALMICTFYMYLYIIYICTSISNTSILKTTHFDPGAGFYINIILLGEYLALDMTWQQLATWQAVVSVFLVCGPISELAWS